MLAAEKEQSFAALSVCLDLSPSHGGAYRAVVDLARAVDYVIVIVVLAQLVLYRADDYR